MAPFDRSRLPMEVSRNQPYSVGPVTGWDETAMRISPALGTVRGIDNPHLGVMLTLVAPTAIQRAARALGVNGVVKMKAPGLVEAIERDQARRAEKKRGGNVGG